MQSYKKSNPMVLTLAHIVLYTLTHTLRGLISAFMVTRHVMMRAARGSPPKTSVTAKPASATTYSTSQSPTHTVHTLKKLQNTFSSGAALQKVPILAVLWIFLPSMRNV